MTSSDNNFVKLQVTAIPFRRAESVWVASYLLASQFLAPEVIHFMPLPVAKVGQHNEAERLAGGLIIDGPLPNWLMAYVALQCQGAFEWIAVANYQLPKLCSDLAGKGVAVVVDSRADSMPPGTIVRWHDEYCDLPPLIASTSDDREAYFVFDMPTASEEEQIVHINAGTFVDPRRITDFEIPLSQDSAKTKLTFSYAGPTWLHAYLAIGATKSDQVRQIAIFNLRTPNPIPSRPPGSIVVYSRDPSLPCGTFVDNGDFIPAGRFPGPSANQESVAGLAIAIIGLPQSGKSVLARALYALTAHLPGVFAIEANPDGEGMYFQYVTGDMANQVRHKWKFKPELGDRYHDQIIALKKRLNITWVSLGGLPSEQSKRTLEACTHAIMLCRDSSGDVTQEAKMTQAMAAWSELCRRTDRPVIARLTSRLHETTSQITFDPSNGALLGIAARRWLQTPKSVPSDDDHQQAYPSQS